MLACAGLLLLNAGRESSKVWATEDSGTKANQESKKQPLLEPNNAKRVCELHSLDRTLYLARALRKIKEKDGNIVLTFILHNKPWGWMFM